jgi:8-oxo-dGTP pyrophosphatase MutT (NUDIX family)
MKQVVGTLFFKDKKLLIDKPRKRKTFQMIGGSVEENESIFDAAVRECKEELGENAIFDSSKIKFLMEFDEIATSDPNLKIHMNIFIYDGVLEGELTTSDEIESFMWFSRIDDINLLSNTLKNEIIPYAIENELI